MAPDTKEAEFGKSPLHAAPDDRTREDIGREQSLSVASEQITSKGFEATSMRD